MGPGPSLPLRADDPAARDRLWRLTEQLVN